MQALMKFMSEKGAELGNLGRPSLGECPPHCLQPGTYIYIYIYIYIYVYMIYIYI